MTPSPASSYAEDTCLNNQAADAAPDGAVPAGDALANPFRDAHSPSVAESLHSLHSFHAASDDGAETVSRRSSGGSDSGSDCAGLVAGAVPHATDSPSKAAVEQVEDVRDNDNAAAADLTRAKTAPLPPLPAAPAPTRLARAASSYYGAGAAAHIPPAPQPLPAAFGRSISARSGGQLSSSSSSTASDDDGDSPFTFPEGGRQAWLVVFASFCAMLCVFGIINTAAVFESWFATHQLAAYSASEIGWIFSLYLFCVFFVGIQVGPVFDRYGPRALVAAGSVLVVASILLLGLCTRYYQILLCYSVLGGLGGALLNTPAYACIAHFFNARRGLATGVATTSGGVGGIVFPILLQKLLPRLGFAWSTRILGFILLALTVPANLWLRTRLPLPGVVEAAEAAEAEAAAARARAQAAALGTDHREHTDHPDNTAHATTTTTRSHRRLASVLPDFSIFRDPRYAVAAAGVFFMEWGIFVPVTFIVSYATAHGQDADDAYTLLALLNAGSVLGRFLPGLLADRIGRFNVIILTIALSAAAVLAVWLPAGASRPVLTAFAVLFGFASGSNLGLIAVCLGQLCAPGEYGRYYATAMMVASFGTLSSVPIGGAILGSGASAAGWTGLIAFSGVSYALALVCYTAARVLAVGWRVRAKF